MIAEHAIVSHSFEFSCQQPVCANSYHEIVGACNLN